MTQDTMNLAELRKLAGVRPYKPGEPWMNRAAAEAPHIFAAQLARRLKEGD